jgi:hypothetical protein
LAENFSAQISKPGLSLRFEAMKKYNIEDISIAASKVLLTRKIMGMPTVAELIEAMGVVEPRQIDIAQQQVNEIMAQVRNIGSYGTPVFSDPVTIRLMKSRWSWKSLCAMTETEHKWWAKDFIEAYKSADTMDRHEAIECTPRLKLLTGKIGRI